MLSSQKRIIEQAKFTYSSLGKGFKKQTKTIEDQWKNQDNALKTLELKDKEEQQSEAIEDKKRQQGKSDDELSTLKNFLMNY